MVKKERIPVMYSVGVKSVPHALGVGHVAAVFLYMHFKEQEDGDDDVEDLDYRMVAKKSLWSNGTSEANWKAIKIFVEKHLKDWFPKEAVPAQYYEKVTLGYALPASRKDEVDKIFDKVFDELNIESDSHWRWDETLQIESVPYKPVNIIFFGKHSNISYLAQTPYDAGNIFLTVLRDRLNNGDYNWMQEFAVSARKPTYTKEEVNALPESMRLEKKKMLEAITEYERETAQAKKYHEWWGRINKAVLDRDPYVAKTLLTIFKSGEYEDFTISEFDEFDNFNIKL